MSARLVKVGTGERFELRKQRVLMGRRSDCDIVLIHPMVSAHHCVLQRNDEDGCWYVKDLGSTNGTWVNGRQVVESQLSPRDVISLGKHPRFQFECVE